jgi:hypothetical protein
MRQERIIEQIDKMVASGRITEEEAAQLRATEGTAASMLRLVLSALVMQAHTWSPPSPTVR